MYKHYLYLKDSRLRFRAAWTIFAATFALLASPAVAQKSVSVVRPKVVTESKIESSDASDPYANLARAAAPYLKFNRLIKSVVKVCQPSVVHIEAQKSVQKRNGGLTRIEEAGAGVIIKHRGKLYVITNRHVVADAKLSSILIQSHDGRFFRPTELRSDRDTDLAVLFTSEKKFMSSRIGNSEKTEVGDFVIAVGSPFGLNHSVSMGIISAKGRRDLDLGDSGVRLQNFIQTDAAINPGNSGGPLLNIQGELIGVNTAIASNSGHNEGIGFAIPVNMVMRIVTDLIDYGRVRRGFLGVSLDSKYTADKAKSLGLTTIYGARVTAITPGSPASKIDVRVGDVILRYNGKRIENDSHLVNEVNLTRLGQNVPMVIYRDGATQKLNVTIRTRN